MTDTDTGASPATDAPEASGAGTDNAAFSMTVKAQYIKDFSFENPKAPGSLRADLRPEIRIGVDVRAGHVAQDFYEVALLLNVSGEHEGEKVFIIELSYAGVFQLHNIGKDEVEYTLMVECPRLLFPFARQIIGQATTDGGYPPLHLQPIDFAGVYNNRKAQQAESGPENGNVDVATAAPEGTA